ncbi:LPS export ABC transporter permease LptG [Novosphingobium sp. FSY-8]|uniref:LPS export ABC transporter permease LptG n=1 Tax=Novosphingobium ovatum TaxID=1908523 RepID=A0ABW9XF44_9SPHN|nr:LPS export ABC transporter permease LptG [Novosphingobium ovatum]NBC37141.1 LPS export ABC transporter permease LptG [Novosphingobium ovatum]
MLTDWFPSRTLAFYLARLFVTRILGVLIMLVLVLQVLDLLSESGAILAHEGNGQAQILHYVTLRTPQLVARFLPYSVLLATLFTFFPLNQNSEVIAMRAAGLSAHQILAPMMATALVVSGVSFTFNELVVTRSTAQLKAWQEAGWGQVPTGPEVRSNVYMTDGTNILAADTMTGAGAAIEMTGVTWYGRDSNGTINTQMRSPRAVYANPGWRMEDVAAFDTATARTQHLPFAVVARALTPRQISITRVDADWLNLFALSRSINTLRANGFRTAELDGKWWHKISGPLAALLMPLLGSVAAFGLARSGQLLIRAVVGMALGFTYFVVDNMALAIGNFGGYPPLIAAWAPFLLFAVVGEAVLIRSEE